MVTSVKTAVKLSARRLRTIVESVIAEASESSVELLSRAQAEERFPDAFPPDEEDPSHMPDYSDDVTYAVIGGKLHAYDPMDVIDHVWEPDRATGAGSGWIERIDSSSKYASDDDDEYVEALSAELRKRHRTKKESR